MNKNVIKTMIILCICYLVAWYFLKLFIPEKFVLCVDNPKLIALGNKIDSNPDLRTVLGIITSFITYFIFLCAVSRRKVLPIEWSLITLIIVIISFGIAVAYPNYLAYYSIFAMILLATNLGANLKDTATVLIIHSISQLLSLSIRNVPNIWLDYNWICRFILGIESYFWLFLFYLYFNYNNKKEVSKK